MCDCLLALGAPDVPKKRRHRQQRQLPTRVEPREGGGLALLVGGVTQSVSAERAHDGYWGMMLPPSCPDNALLLGLGGATVAHLLAARCPNTRIVGVERDAAVLALARASFGLDTLAHLRIVEGDAFAWVAAQFVDERQALAEGAKQYDLICVDLFEAGRLTAGVLATQFLRQVAALLTPEGVASFNLMITGRTPEQLHRLRRVFSIEREQRLGGNVVVHVKPLPLSDEIAKNEQEIHPASFEARKLRE